MPTITRDRPSTDTDIESQNFSLFRDCLASRVLFSLSADRSKAIGSAQTPTSEAGDSDDLADFTSYLACEAWPSLPSSLRALTHELAKASGEPDADDIPLTTLPPAFSDTLTSYSLISAEDADAPQHFLRKVIASYIPLAVTPPPVWSSTRATECEICEREVPLTYHHLIPRSVHAKVLKRGWHKEEMLGSVAWLCRYESIFIFLCFQVCTLLR